MNKKRERSYQGLFLVAAVYDLILGFSFLFFYKFMYSFLNISLPDNPAYLSLSAAFVFVIGIGYYFIYLDIYSNKALVKLGIIYKIAYAIIAFYYFFLGTIPHIVFILFAVIDIIFIFLFVEFLHSLRKEIKK